MKQETTQATQAVIYWFSGTGNSYRVATLAAERFEAAGLRAATRPIEEGLHPDHATARIHGFAYPVYGLGMPDIMRRFMKALPPVNGTAAFATCAIGDYRPEPRGALRGYEGIAIYQARSILGRRGYRVVADEAVHTPQNWFLVNPACKPEVNDAICAVADAQVVGAVGDILRSSGRRKNTAFIWRVLSTLLYWLFILAGRRGMGLMLYARSSCNGCGLCAAKCPARTIAMQGGRPSWGLSCENCMRCVVTCPRRAVHVSLWPLLIGAALVPLALWIVDLLVPAGALHQLADVGVYTALCGALLPLLSWTRRTRWGLACWNRLSYSGRWTAYVHRLFKPAKVCPGRPAEGTSHAASAHSSCGRAARASTIAGR
jgi:ferredoxin/flavodoxin